MRTSRAQEPGSEGDEAFEGTWPEPHRGQARRNVARRLARWLAPAVLMVGGLLVLGLLASPASAQEFGGGDIGGGDIVGGGSDYGGSDYGSGDIGSTADTGAYAGSDTGQTGFEGSPEIGPTHAEAVNDTTDTGSGDTTGVGDPPGSGVTLADAGDATTTATTTSAGPYAGSETGRTGFEGSPEVGPTLAWSMRNQEEYGQRDAQNLRSQLTAAGLDPDNFHPDQLNALNPADPRYISVFGAVYGLGYNMVNPPLGDERLSGPYATRAYETLGVEGTRAMYGAINQLAFDQNVRGADPLGGDIRTELLDPAVQGFAAATRSPIAPTEVFDGLRQLDAGWQQHQLGQMISGGFAYDPANGQSTRVPGSAYDPTQLAQFADAIVDFGRSRPGGMVTGQVVDPGTAGTVYDRHAFDPHARPGNAMYADPAMWDGDVAMQVPEALALRALSADPEAAWQFTGMRPENLQATLRPTSNLSAYWGYTPDQTEQLRSDMNQSAAAMVRGTLVDIPTNDPGRYPQALDRYADVVRNVNDGYVPDPQAWGIENQLNFVGNRLGLTGPGQPPNEVKQEVANALGVYIDDIGQSVVRQSETPYSALYGPRAAEVRASEDFNRPDLVNFAQSLGTDEESARRLGLVTGGWALGNALPSVGVGAPPTSGDLTEAMRPVGLLTGAFEDGFDAIGTDAARAYQAYAQGVGTVTSVIAAGAGIGAFAIGGKIAPWISAGGASQWAGGTIYGLATTARSPEQPMTGTHLENVMLGQLRQDLAGVVAQNNPEVLGRLGLDPAAPVPAGFQSRVLAEAFPTVRDAIDGLDRAASDKADDYGEYDHWSTR